MLKIPTCKTDNWLSSKGFTREEEIEIFSINLQEVYDNVRYILDNLEYLPEYRVSFGNYNGVNKITFIPE